MSEKNPARPNCFLRYIQTTALFMTLLQFLFSTGCKNRTGTASEQPLKIVTFGDSITRGIRDGVNESQTFTFYLGQLLRKQDFKVEMIRKGISGEKTNEALSRITRDVIALNPRYVTIMYGTNDAYIDVYRDPNRTTPKIPLEDYQRNLTEMVRLLKKNNITPILMTPIPMGKFWGWNVGIYGSNDINFKLKEYAQAVRTVAARENALLVDHFTEWLDWKSRRKDIDAWMTDGIHPNPKGHRLIAAAIFKVLVTELQK